jgi:hypothetical protein
MSSNPPGAEVNRPLVAEHDGNGGGSGRSDRPGQQSNRTTQAVVAALAAVPGDLERLINGKTAEDLAQPAQDGRWGLIEILPHFCDWEEICLDRVNRILNEDVPALEDYDDSLWAIEHEYSQQDPIKTLRQFTELRGALVERVGNLAPEQWEREAVLPKRGRITLFWLLDNLTAHDAKHVVQARDVLA